MPNLLFGIYWIIYDFCSTDLENKLTLLSQGIAIVTQQVSSWWTYIFFYFVWIRPGFVMAVNKTLPTTMLERDQACLSCSIMTQTHCQRFCGLICILETYINVMASICVIMCLSWSEMILAVNSARKLQVSCRDKYKVIMTSRELLCGTWSYCSKANL